MGGGRGEDGVEEAAYLPSFAAQLVALGKAQAVLEVSLQCCTQRYSWGLP